MSFLIEGAAQNSASAATCVASITTTHQDDIIIALVDVFANGSPTLNSVTGVSGLGLTWHRRSTTTVVSHFGSTYPVIHEVWWAYSHATVAGNVTATCTNPGSPNYMGLTLFGVNGANLTTPFDVNASLPATVSFGGSGGSTSHPVTGISATSANVLELATLTTAAQHSSISADTGFTLLESFTYGPYLGVQSEYAAKASLATASLNVFTGVSDSSDYIAQVDAIQAPAASIASSNSTGELFFL